MVCVDLLCRSSHLPLPSQGTIVEWTANVGQFVKEGDVVALVETDKVTVDIKAEMDGVITSVFGEVDETVEVGSKLYEIDTDAEATATASSGESGPAVAEKEDEEAAVESAPAETPVAAAVTEDVSAQHRTPSIHFLGKKGWKNRLAGIEETPAGAAPAMQQPPASPSAAVTLDGSGLTPNYGRLPMTEREMEALILGGAETAPSLVSPSGPAMFAP
jgi:pyruvate/2-oxoglutarate dehydrogenase complex dihydrolipoamide acyltransferase (E2) component